MIIDDLNHFITVDSLIMYQYLCYSRVVGGNYLDPIFI